VVEDLAEWIQKNQKLLLRDWLKFLSKTKARLKREHKTNPRIFVSEEEYINTNMADLIKENTKLLSVLAALDSKTYDSLDAFFEVFGHLYDVYERSDIFSTQTGDETAAKMAPVLLASMQNHTVS
jgi:hypothetical protein